MLYHQHLKPWLVIYLLATLLVFISAIGILVMIILNDINGFSFTKTVFSSCPPYVNLKLNLAIEIGLKVSFVMTIFAIIFTLGQCGIAGWQFFLFTTWSKENNQSETKPFETMSKKILILLYLLNAIAFFTLIPVIGWFATLFMDLGECTGNQNQSNTYSFPAAVAGSGLIFQIFSFCLLMKLLYHFNQNQNDSSSQNDEKPKEKYKFRQDQFQTPQARQARRLRQKIELEQLKKRILLSKNEQNQLKVSMGNQAYNSNSTNASPNLMKDQLLAKNTVQDDVYGGTPNNTLLDKKQLRRKKKMNKITNYQPYNDQSPNFHYDEGSSPVPFNRDPPNSLNSLENSPNQIASFPININRQYPAMRDPDLSPNQITSQQRNLMKAIPRNGYKKNKRHRNSPNGVIFQDPDEQNLNEIHEPIKRKKPAEKYISEQEQKKAQIQIRKLKNIIDSISPKSTKGQDFYIFKTKYNHYMHLLKSQKQVVTNSERRCIKRPLLSIKSKIVQFDAKNYEIQEFLIKPDPNDQSPYKSNNSQNQIGPDAKQQNGGQNNPNTQPPLAQLTNEINLQITPQMASRTKPLKTAAQIWQKGFIDGVKAQYYNPIRNYLDQGEQYEEKIRKILQFDQIGAKKRSQDFDPFEPIPGKQKAGQDNGKLFLHKNKPKASRAQIDDPLEEYCDRSDPFKDMAFEDDWQLQRGALTRDDTNENSGKTEKKGFIEGLLGTAQPARRVNRKEGGLVQLIRGKQPVSFL